MSLHAMTGPTAPWPRYLIMITLTVLAGLLSRSWLIMFTVGMSLSLLDEWVWLLRVAIHQAGFGGGSGRGQGPR